MVWMVLLACTGKEPIDTDTTVYADPVLCESEPVDGFARFSLESDVRGLSEVLPDIRDVLEGDDQRFGAGLAAGDLDGDGDFDLIAGRFQKPPWVYINDGTGHFEVSGDILGPVVGTYADMAFGGRGMPMVFSIMDLDGDGVVEVISSGFGFLAVYPGLGGGAFGDPELVHNDDQIVGIYLGFSVGDMDGDADLDIALISDVAVDMDCDGSGCEHMEWPDYLLENDGAGGFTKSEQLFSAPGVGSHALLALFTDRDNDDDMDLFVPKDYLGDNAFWRNDGGEWVDDDAEIGADYTWSAMGIDAVDLNDDGWLDYCLTDTGPVRCLLSTGTDSYVEGGAALGLMPDGASEQNETVGWSLIFSDLDNDGFWDATYPAGPMGQQTHTNIEDVPDAMFAGNPDGTFTDTSAVAGFNDTNDNYGMVQADFDGDGFLEIVLSGPGQPLQYYDNACNGNHWIELDFEGAGANTEGWGAKVTVEAGGRRWMRELLPLGGPAHSPPRVHIGLGDIDSVDSVTVTWPDGSSATASDLPTRRVHTLTAQ